MRSKQLWLVRDFEAVRVFQENAASGSDGKASVYNVGDLGLIPGLGRSPGEGNGNPLQDYLPGKFHRQKSLVGYSPWGCKESDTTERLHRRGI